MSSSYRPDESQTRRVFHKQIFAGLLGLTFPFPDKPLFARNVFSAGRLSDDQVTRFGLTLRNSDDLALMAGLPFSGVYCHCWCGNACQFRQSSRAALAIAQQCGELLNTKAPVKSLAELMRQFFGHSELRADSSTFVLVTKGHITNRHAVSLQGITSIPRVPDDGLRFTGTRAPKRMTLVFDGAHSKFNVSIDRFPWSFTPPPNNPNAGLCFRHVRREYIDRAGRSSGVDFINQSSPADGATNGPDFATLRRGGYFPNTGPLRDSYNAEGYTDLSSIRLVRTVHASCGRPRVHEIVLDINSGLLRSGPILMADNPDEVLSVLTLNRPLERFLDQNRGVISMLEDQIG